MAETTPAEHALAFLRELRDLCDRYAARLRAPDGPAGPGRVAGEPRGGPTRA
jgi:hypothetical protein